MARESIETARLWRDRRLEGIEFLAAHYLTHSFAPHAHETFAIGVVTSGALSFSYRTDRQVVTVGDAMILNPGQMHTGQAIGPQGYTYVMFYLPAELLTQITCQGGGKASGPRAFPSSCLHDSTLADRVLRLCGALEDASALPLECESRLLAILARLTERHAQASDPVSEGRSGHTPVKQAVAYPQAHYADGVSLKELAAVENLSPFYLLRVFARTIGVPPHVYQMQLRVRHARELLAQGLAPVEVAVEVGFADQSHLTRCFRRMVGVTPGQFQRSCAAR